jgi:hypothetical protein
MAPASVKKCIISGEALILSRSQLEEKLMIYEENHTCSDIQQSSTVTTQVQQMLFEYFFTVLCFPFQA